MSGPLTAWRIERAEYARDVRTGNGARLYGGRWNSPGRPCIYCAATAALAMLEVRVHVNSIEDAAIKRVLFSLTVAPELIAEIPLTKLPKGWRSALNVAPCRRLGDRWLAEARSAALLVPSAIVTQERNLLLNPAHPDFKAIRWSRPTPCVFDPRLVAELR